MTIEEYWSLHTEREDHWTPETCVQCLHCAEIGDRRTWTEEELNLV